MRFGAQHTPGQRPSSPHRIVSEGRPRLGSARDCSSESGQPFLVPPIRTGGLASGLKKEVFVEAVEDIITVGEFYQLAAGGQIIFT